jgi:hypothetical protein
MRCTELVVSDRRKHTILLILIFFHFVEHARLSAEYESIKHENEILNEHYLTAELENFEISSYYEQILAEEKAKTAQLENEYTQTLKALGFNYSSPPSSPQSFNTSSSTTTKDSS